MRALIHLTIAIIAVHFSFISVTLWVNQNLASLWPVIVIKAVFQPIAMLLLDPSTRKGVLLLVNMESGSQRPATSENLVQSWLELYLQEPEKSAVALYMVGEMCLWDVEDDWCWLKAILVGRYSENTSAQRSSKHEGVQILPSPPSLFIVKWVPGGFLIQIWWLVVNVFFQFTKKDMPVSGLSHLL